jgi:rubrerythrin
MKQTFTRIKENFICSICGQKVEGNGFTDHCPKCLWSRHVDINPGDRGSKCLGLMEPIGVKMEKSEWKISYQCQLCGYTHQCKSAKDDNVDKIIELSTHSL